MKTTKQILVGATILVSSFLNAQTITLPLNQGGNFDGGTILSVDVGNANYTALAFEGKIGTHEQDINSSDQVPTANSGMFFEASNNSLYIVTKHGEREVGEIEGNGVIFKYDITSKETTLIKQMTYDKMGLNAFGGLSKIGSKLYGVTARGGEYGFGVIFSIDIATDTYNVEHSFNGTTDGGSPTCQLYNDGIGTTLYGSGSRTNGANGEVYFKFDTSTSTYSVLYTSTSTAAHNVAGIFERGGWLYFSRFNGIRKLDLNNLGNGVTTYYTGSTGGSVAYDFTERNGDWYAVFESDGSLGYGTIAKFDFSSSGINMIHNFQGGAGFGQNPRTKLVDGPQSEIYGTSLGVNDDYVLYAANTDGTNYHILHNFTSQNEGLRITASPVYDGTTNLLYGISEKEGANGYGTIWSFNLGSNIFEVEAQLGFLDGKGPLNGLSLNPATNQYGFVTFKGGSEKGTLNSFNTNTQVQTKTTDINESDIKSVFHTPIYYNSKTYLMVQFSDGANATYESFNGILEIDETTGLKIGSPILIAPATPILIRVGGIAQGNIIQDGSIVYGISTQYLWKIDLSNGNYSTLHTFNETIDGDTPQSIILEGNVLYGINNKGGTNSAGTVFKYDLGTTTFSVIEDAPATDSYHGLVLNNNKLYTAKTTNTTNTIASLDLSSGTPTFSDLVTLDPVANGSNPAPFIKVFNGFIYGVLNSGAANNLGGIYKYEIAPTTLTQLISFDATTGNNSYNSEILVINSPLSIDDLHSNLAVKVYPNPTNSIITIETELEINSIQLLNNIGQQVLEQKNNVIDISNLNNGIYFLKINSDKGFISKKIIKK